MTEQEFRERILDCLETLSSDLSWHSRLPRTCTAAKKINELKKELEREKSDDH